ncbi:MAG: alpha-D-ribose 1-methylphosphonate 5-triphosphate diphosphatase [Acetobacteraceae bacterium]|nr:alpha-D-ribose 1-methylphosphonate 5-triphosphate diphosphatase [Acetobacteraceae bacterium]
MADTLATAENAFLVLADRVQHGWLTVGDDGRIAAIGEGRAPERGANLNGDTLIPGLVELHTDHLESHYYPRPAVRWHKLGAVLAYDAQIAASGITTVFDSLRAGTDEDGGDAGADLFELAKTIEQAAEQDLLRASHITHLRCEMPADDVMNAVKRFVAHRLPGLMSLMDHTPGQRQFRDLDKYLIYARKTGKEAAEVRERARERMRQGTARAQASRPALIRLAQEHGVPLASHDDTTADDVAQAAEEGIALSEFPTTMEAASACHENGITVVVGAPNLLRGGSHSGNVSAEALARAGLLDILSSDYIPGSLLMAAFALPQRVPAITLPDAIATVTRNPARAVHLRDRGEIAPGMRADLVRVHMAGALPVVRQVWRGGRRIA